ncbi:MAG: ATP-binding cassette domain-containing protein [Rickettsiaceae bacterium]|nr:ATP-binding cassette domain-containing protein [Rickettsiaceae bacterium]
MIALSSVSATLLAIGYIFRKLIDTGLATSEVSAINNTIFSLIILIVIFAIGSFFRSYSINNIAEKITAQIKSDTYHHLLKLDIITFEDLKIGDIISRLNLDVENIGNLITNFLSFFIRNFILLIGSIVLMIIQSPKLSLLVLFTIPVLLFPLLKLSKLVRRLSATISTEKSMLSANIEENFAAIRTLHSFNQQENMANHFQNTINIYTNHASKRLKYRSLFFALAMATIAGSITAVIWIGSIDIVNGILSSGQMISFIYYAILVGMSAGGIAELFSELQAPLASLDKVLELKRMLPSDTTDELASNQDITKYDITFENVSFNYPARPDIVVLKNISFHIKAGKFTGIVGKSGSGKSTFMQILLKFYTNWQGLIKIGDIDIKDIAADKIRKKIAYIQQDPFIFSGTIKSNITFSNPTATEQDIAKVIKICGIDDFIKNLPDGIYTQIGERGVRISGGQKQRIAIARGLLYNPEILLLDEATSALDRAGEKQLLNNVMKFMQGKTIISIAHRITSIENADNILVINDGIVADCGKHQELIKNSAIYNNLYSSQTKE